MGSEEGSSSPSLSAVGRGPVLHATRFKHTATNMHTGCDVMQSNYRLNETPNSHPRICPSRQFRMGISLLSSQERYSTIRIGLFNLFFYSPNQFWGWRTGSGVTRLETMADPHNLTTICWNLNLEKNMPIQSRLPKKNPTLSISNSNQTEKVAKEPLHHLGL